MSSRLQVILLTIVSGHGKCNNNVCECSIDFYGGSCDTKCSNNCNNHGECVVGNNYNDLLMNNCRSRMRL